MLHAVLWLETYLKSFENTLIVVSHARDFLNEVLLSFTSPCCKIGVHILIAEHIFKQVSRVCTLSKRDEILVHI